MARLDATIHPLPLRAGVSLSYLREGEQELVEAYLDKPDAVMDIRRAEELRKISEEHEIAASDIERLLFSTPVPATKRRLHFERAVINRYFTDEQSDDEIARTITEALEHYFSSRQE
jgi:ParB family chromosome partitioning protein